MFFLSKFFPFSRFEIKDKSMEPNFYEGDYVLTFNWATPRVNDAIVFKKGQNFNFKRVTKIAGSLFYVSGDNVKMSSKFGPVKKSQIIGKVVLKY